MCKISMIAFAPAIDKPCPLKLSDQFTDFTRHVTRFSLPPLLPFLNPGPGITQRHRAVEYQRTGPCIKVNTEIPLALELVPTARRSPGETGLQLAPSQHFQGLWIEQLGQISAVLVSARVGVEKEMVVQAHLRWN